MGVGGKVRDIFAVISVDNSCGMGGRGGREIGKVKCGHCCGGGRLLDVEVVW